MRIPRFKTDRAMPDFFGKRILFHRVTVFCAAVIAMVFLSVTLWEQNSESFLKREEFHIAPDRVHVSAPSSEYASQLKAEIVNNVTGTEANSLDTGLVARVVSFVEQRPEVKETFVRKSAAQLDVQVELRQAVAMIESGSSRYYLDSDAVVLGNLPQKELIRITINRPSMSGVTKWQTWPDPRVLAAVDVCDAIQDVWQEFEIFRVVTYWDPQSSPDKNETFELWTKFGGKVVWSNVIPNGEASVDQKIAAIRNHIAQHGPLGKLAGDKKLDVRFGQTSYIKDVRTAEKNDWLEKTRTAGEVKSFGLSIDR